MPGWIWLVLVIFMIAMLVGGAIYVVFRAMAAMRSVGRLSSAIEEKLSPVQEDDENSAEAPLFTRPLHVAGERYSVAHAEVLRRHDRIHERHMRTWQQWKHFND
ncbi:hypothetical protein [Bifidobacterium sp.]|uniref:hypothetical protein n=1 Tax=Bifidobacterium sp. TaxID=41200 RepID=UPI0039E9E869